MTPEQLRDAYWATRHLLANRADIGAASTTRAGRKRAARGVPRLLRDIDLIVNVARGRGINLLDRNAA